MNFIIVLTDSPLSLDFQCQILLICRPQAKAFMSNTVDKRSYYMVYLI